ncbi:hypothetical protein HUJ04_006945 [Dendroctonus ponderosae]|nr:hypothetical protein HUJ04_006945 [Dendroctonus ponderosae]
MLRSFHAEDRQKRRISKETLRNYKELEEEQKIKTSINPYTFFINLKGLTKIPRKVDIIVSEWMGFYLYISISFM